MKIVIALGGNALLRRAYGQHDIAESPSSRMAAMPPAFSKNCCAGKVPEQPRPKSTVFLNQLSRPPKLFLPRSMAINSP